VVQVDTESEQSAVTGSPFFQVVRRGYDHLGRVHADISTLLERTLKHKAQEVPAAEGTAEPKAHPSPRPPASRP